MRTRFLAIFTALLFCFAVGTSAVHASGHHTAATVTASSSIPMFDAESAAQKHCPSDEVVWLNTRSGIYHEKGMRWYGRTKYGAYVCRKEADAAGYRDTRNGQ